MHSDRTARFVKILAAATLLACATAGDTALASPATQSVAFQQNAAHDGHIADAAIATPLQEQWSRTLPRVSQPLIVNGMVYVTSVNLSTGDTTLYALDQASGVTRWSRTDHFNRWMSPAYDRGQIFVHDLDNVLTAFDAETGTTNWSKQMPGQSSSDVSPDRRERHRLRRRVRRRRHALRRPRARRARAVDASVAERRHQLARGRRERGVRRVPVPALRLRSAVRRSRSGTTTARARAAGARPRRSPRAGCSRAARPPTRSTPPRRAPSWDRSARGRSPRSPGASRTSSATTQTLTAKADAGLGSTLWQFSGDGHLDDGAARGRRHRVRRFLRGPSLRARRGDRSAARHARRRRGDVGPRRVLLRRPARGLSVPRTAR